MVYVSHEYVINWRRLLPNALIMVASTEYPNRNSSELFICPELHLSSTSLSILWSCVSSVVLPGTPWWHSTLNILLDILRVAMSAISPWCPSPGSAVAVKCATIFTEPHTGTLARGDWNKMIKTPSLAWKLNIAFLSGFLYNSLIILDKAFLVINLLINIEEVYTNLTNTIHFSLIGGRML